MKPVSCNEKLQKLISLYPDPAFHQNEQIVFERFHQKQKAKPMI